MIDSAAICLRRASEILAIDALSSVVLVPHFLLGGRPMATPPNSLVTPEWVTAPIDRCVEDLQRLADVVRMSANGIAMLCKVPAYDEARAALARHMGEAVDEQAIADGKKDATLAQRELESGFAILHANATVALWSLLEVMINSVVVNWLQNNPSSYETEVIAKLKIRLGEYERLNVEDRASYIAELLEGELGAGLKSGVDRFEAMLKPFGLDGAVPDGLRKQIYELGQVRNAIVHRGAKADRRLIEACPWLGLNTSQHVTINSVQFSRYVHVAVDYATLILCRVGTCFGRNMSASVEQLNGRYPAA